MEGSTLILTVEKGPRVGQTVECTTGSVIKIGRVIKGNTFTIKNPGISTNHLIIEFKDSKWVISDLDSSNGTILNEVTLQPMKDYDLRDEDEIKIGERSCLKVKIVKKFKPTESPTKISRKESVDVAIEKEVDAENGEDGQFRRNLRRKAAPKNTRAYDEETSKCSVASVSKLQKVSTNPNLALGNCGRTESVTSVADTRPQRGRPRKIKDEPPVVQLISKSSELGQEICKEPENGVPAGEKRTRRGAPRRVKGTKDEQLTTSVVQKISENPNADPLNFTEVSNVAEKSRVSKEDEPLESVSDMQEGLENLSFDHQEFCKETQNLAPVEKKQARRVAQKRTKASQDEPSEFVQIPVPEASENYPKQSRRVAQRRNRASQDEPSESVQIPVPEAPENDPKQSRRVAQRRTKASQDEPSESVQILVPEAPEIDPKQSNLQQEFPKQSNLEQETCNESASTSAPKENFVPESDENVRKEIDWEKMTLGKWFDYLEDYFPKQVHEITDEIILSMRERSKQFNEFMLQQAAGKAKLPII